jgi:hypothetical protein
MKRIILFFCLCIATILFCGELIAQNILYYSSDSYTQAYIVQSERNMVAPIQTLNGLTDSPGVTQSEQTMTLYKPSGDSIQEMNNKRAQITMHQFQHIQGEIKKENYYDDVVEAMGNIQELNHDNSSPRDYEKQYYTSPEFAAKTKSYSDALVDIKAMLNGQKPLSIRGAYFELENAYGNLYLDHKYFNNEIDKSANFIRHWMAEHKLDQNDNEALNYAIQKFMADTLSVTLKLPDSRNPSQTVIHLPFHYDYVDFEGAQDYRNFFVTKCISTGYGQCNSMPATYLCLAEALGAKVYLSFAPQHSLVKYPDKKGHLHNYEVTTNWYIPDRWYEDNMFIKPEAIQSGIFLDTLDNREIVANCMVDLAIGYMKKFGPANGQFVMDCLRSADKEFPYHNNIFLYFTYSSLAARYLDREQFYDKTSNLSDTLKNADAKRYYHDLQRNETLIKNLGYQDVPEQAYAQWMRIDTAKGRKQTEYDINSKQNHDLFIITK